MLDVHTLLEALLPVTWLDNWWRFSWRAMSKEIKQLGPPCPSATPHLRSIASVALGWDTLSSATYVAGAQDPRLL